MEHLESLQDNWDFQTWRDNAWHFRLLGTNVQEEVTVQGMFMEESMDPSSRNAGWNVVNSGNDGLIPWSQAEESGILGGDIPLKFFLKKGCQVGFGKSKIIHNMKNE